MGKNFIKFNVLLYPVSWIYGAVTSLRNKFFDWGIYKEQSFDIPVIAVGNITVGGTGKTPHTEYLIRLLSKYYKVAVLSRGYKRKSKGFVLANAGTPVEIIGDEPFQMKHKFPNIYIAVDADRCNGITQLCHSSKSSDTEVIILDDAYQHRYVRPGMNILLVDYNRMLCDDMILPAGRMRESEKGKNRANIIIVTKCPRDISHIELRVLHDKINAFPYQKLYFTTLTYGKLKNITGSGKEYDLSKIQKDVNILLVTGIANPGKLLEDLKPYNDNIIPLPFGDHHDFDAADMQLIKQRFEQLHPTKRMILTTEKDAVRLASNKFLEESLKPYIYILPVEISFINNQEDSFNLNITDYVRKNSRNSIFS